MVFKSLIKKKYPIPNGVTLTSCVALPLENVFHTPGQTAAIRFFDPHSQKDLASLREILHHKQVKKWMDDTYYLTKREYQDWAGTVTHNNFLFAVLDARVSSLKAMETIYGFVYIYSEREEKFRVRRMLKKGFLTPTTKTRYSLEVSFAAKPQKNGIILGTGLMASAIRQACLQVQMLLNTNPKPVIDIFAFVDPVNEPAQRTLIAAGFAKIGSMKYDWDSPGESLLYSLNWRILQKKIRQKLVELQAIKP